MKLEQSFEIQAPLDEVWVAIIDLERVAPCLPGAAITSRDEDGTYHGTFQVKLGPATASYNGTVTISDVDEAAHTATLRAKGTDRRGQGGATATVVNRLSASDGGTRVDAETDMAITGRLAAFGRPGMIKDISNRMLSEFASCLQSRLAAGGEAGGQGAETVPEENVVAGDAAPAQAAAAAHSDNPPVASTPTGAPSGMVGGALSAPPATDPDEGVAGATDDGGGAREDQATGGSGGPDVASATGGSAGDAAGSGTEGAFGSGAHSDSGPRADTTRRGPEGPPQPQFESAPPIQGFSLMGDIVGDRLKANLPTVIGAVLALVIGILVGRSLRSD